MTNKEALEKAARYCARQERCHQQVRDKLYQWGLYKGDVEEVITDLITKNFLNEQRFAEAYAIGKFRQNGWGRNKIKQGLRLKRISDRCIQLGLAVIDEDEYTEKLSLLAGKRLAKGRGAREKQFSTILYMGGRGFENALVREAVSKLVSSNQ